MSPAPRRRPRIALLCVLALGGCKAATLAYGPDAASARLNFDAVASALEQRFTHVVRTAKFANARMRIARYAFAPSKLVNDSAIWTSGRSTKFGGDRELEVSSSLIDGHYTFVARAAVPLPTRTGDERHYIALTHLPNDHDWQWTTTVDHAVGTMPPSRTTDIFRALLASAERPAAAVRADYRGVLPRTTDAFGRMVSIDSLQTTTESDGSTLVAMHFFVSDDRLRANFPALSKFVRQYVAPAKYRFQLTDRTGAQWFDVQAARSRVVLRFRSHDGELQPLVGAARRMPDTLVLRAEGSAKFGFFTVGLKNLVGEFVHVSTSNERAWHMRFTKEPEWDLPLLAEQLLHSPLKRPFEGRGAFFRLGFTRSADGTTLLSRSAVAAVNESAIMRFLGNLGFTAMSDYAGKVEEEENRFLAEGMAAMRADIGAAGK